MIAGSRGAAPLRLGIVAVVCVALFVALFVRLWYLQVLSSEDFVEAADANRLRVVQVEAPRGRILDRDGQVVVDNRASIVVTIDRVRFDALTKPKQRALLARLAEELTRYGTPSTEEDLTDRVRDVRYSRYAPVPVASDVTEELKIYIDEHLDDFPSVSVERRPVRRYVYGTRAAHLLGYIGEINDDELQARSGGDGSYVPGDRVGKSGVERTFEEELRGRPAQMVYEVDNRGRPVRVVEDLSEPAIPGNDVWLTIDINVQAYAEDLLVEALDGARARRPRQGPPQAAPGGSVVVLDPQDGSVLAMASYPTFDLSDFVNGIAPDQWSYLNDPANSYPLNNRAIQGQYAPGSTFKLVTGYAALAAGLRNPDELFRDTGSFTLDECTGRCTFRNAGSKAYGDVDMRRAMTVSSNAYFYAIGADFWRSRDRLGDEALQQSARLFGFDQQTGIPLPSEQDGRIPTPEQRRQQFDANPGMFAERNWFTGDNINMAIGEGDVAATPLQLANAYATFANGGTRYAPNIASKVTRPDNASSVVRTLDPRIASQIDLPAEQRQPLVEGLTGVMTAKGGTATGVFSGFPHDAFPVAGKTGTGQVSGKADTALFAAFGPVPEPRYAVAVVLEESGFGGVAAAPVARKLFDVFAGSTPEPQLEPGGALVVPQDDGSPTQDDLARSGAAD